MIVLEEHILLSEPFCFSEVSEHGLCLALSFVWMILVVVLRCNYIVSLMVFLCVFLMINA